MPASNIFHLSDNDDGTFDPRHIKIMAADTRETKRRVRSSNILEATCWEVLSSQEKMAPVFGRRGCPTTRSPWRASLSSYGCLLIVLTLLWVGPVSAVFVDFQNCLSESVQDNTPLQLQFVPKFVSAVFNTTDPSHNLNVTVWGNVTGSTVELPRLILPPAGDGYWNTTNDTQNGGKIEEIPFPDGADRYTTLFNKLNVLTYEPWNSGVNFCEQLVNGSCPLSPSFFVNG